MQAIRAMGSRRSLDAAELRKTQDSYGNILTRALSALSFTMEALEKLEFPSLIQLPEIQNGINFYDEVERFEAALISRALKNSGGSQRAAAELLGLHSQTLNSKIKKLQIRWRDFKYTRGSTAKPDWYERS